jgi:hypothetical protein
MSTTRKVNPLIRAINNEIQSERETARSLQQRAKTLEAQRMLLRVKYGPVFKDLNEDLSYLNVYFWSNTKPTLSLSLYRLDGFKDQRLTQVLEAFMKWTDEVREEVDASAYRKTYNLELDDVQVSIHASIRSDSATCERVQVGTEVKEVPVYELRCN